MGTLSRIQMQNPQIPFASSWSRRFLVRQQVSGFLTSELNSSALRPHWEPFFSLCTHTRCVVIGRVTGCCLSYLHWWWRTCSHDLREELFGVNKNEQMGQRESSVHFELYTRSLWWKVSPHRLLHSDSGCDHHLKNSQWIIDQQQAPSEPPALFQTGSTSSGGRLSDVRSE